MVKCANPSCGWYHYKCVDYSSQEISKKVASLVIDPEKSESFIEDMVEKWQFFCPTCIKKDSQSQKAHEVNHYDIDYGASSHILATF